MTIDIAGPDEACDCLAPQQMRVGRYGSQHVGIEDVDQAKSAVARSPSDQVVANRKIEDRITKRDDAGEFFVMVVPHQIAKTAPVAGRDWDGPTQAGEPEQVRLPCLSLDELQAELNALGGQLGAGSKVMREPIPSVCQKLLVGKQSVRALLAVEGTHHILAVPREPQGPVWLLDEAKPRQMLAQLVFQV